MAPLTVIVFAVAAVTSKFTLSNEGDVLANMISPRWLAPVFAFHFV
jgi:tryptophan-rich sensory protein